MSIVGWVRCLAPMCVIILGVSWMWVSEWVVFRSVLSEPEPEEPGTETTVVVQPQRSNIGAGAEAP